MVEEARKEYVPEEEVSQGETQEYANQADDYGPEEVHQETPSMPDEDWRVKAMQDPRVRERFDAALLGNQGVPQQEAAPPPVDPVQEAEAKLREVEANAPVLDESNMTAEGVQAFMQWQEDRNRARQTYYDAKLQKTESLLESQRARTVLDEHIESVRQADPAFKDYEQEFRKYVRDNNVDPKLLQNRTVVEMIRKSIGYDHLRSRRKAKAPGAPPVDESYNSQGRAQRQAAAQQNALREPTELDHQLAAFYRIPVEKLIENEETMQGGSERWSMTGSVQWSDAEKLRRMRR